MYTKNDKFKDQTVKSVPKIGQTSKGKLFIESNLSNFFRWYEANSISIFFAFKNVKIPFSDY